MPDRIQPTASDVVARTALNAAQAEAVAYPGRHALVLAGAGSGKTRVLIHRIDWLMRQGVAAERIMAVTFTNKAARELRERIERLHPEARATLTVGTFHGLANRLLRQHPEAAELPAAFQILDADDQVRLVRRIAKEMGYDPKIHDPAAVGRRLDGWKEEGWRAAEARRRLEHPDTATMVALAIYQRYEADCQRSGLVDFAELLLRTLETGRRHPEVLALWRSTWSHLLIDEFQDTNFLQYTWVRDLAGKGGSVFAVGDDDQAIYGWRGAKVAHMQRFLHDFPDVRLFRLEQNYRSGLSILAAANGLIARNPDRLGKTLWTAERTGEPVRIVHARDEQDEAARVVERIRMGCLEGLRLRDHAVLYRSHAQSRAVEEALLASGVAYHIHGGVRFFERAEIKDVMAWLRCRANPDDDVAFERVLTATSNGLGEAARDRLQARARLDHISLWAAARALSVATDTPARQRQAWAALLTTLDQLVVWLPDSLPARDFAAALQTVIDGTGLRAVAERLTGDERAQRLDNLDELVGVADRFALGATADEAVLVTFLAHAALEAGEGRADPGVDAVQLMTLHAAKGLEFPVVLIVGLEEGLFPARGALQDPERMAEERRLAYVGLTRAKRRLVLLHTEARRLYGTRVALAPSRFLTELPAEHLQGDLPPGAGAAAERPRTWMVGQPVRHATWGRGRLLEVSGEGLIQRGRVRFDDGRDLWLALALAPLEPGV